MAMAPPSSALPAAGAGGAERQIEENWHDNDGGDESDEEDRKEEDRKMRHRMRVEYLVEAGKYAVRGALCTTQQIEAALARRRST